MDKYFKNIINAEELNELDMESIKGGVELHCKDFVCSGTYNISQCDKFTCQGFTIKGTDDKPVTPGKP